MMAKRPAPVRDGERSRRRNDDGAARGGARQQGRSRRTAEAPPRATSAPTRRRQRPVRDPQRPQQRPHRAAPPTGPIPHAAEGRGRPRSSSEAKARAKARKAKAPKVVRPPLRQRVLVKLASIDWDPRSWVSRVPFVVLVIGSLGLGLGVTLWLSTGSAERSYRLGEVRETNQALLQQKEALERDVLEAQAAPALAEAARELGMIPSRDTAHLVQDPAGHWVVVGAPTPAEGVPPPPLNIPLPDAVPAPPPAPEPPPVDPREVPVRVPAPGERLDARQAHPLSPMQVGPGPAPIPLATPDGHVPHGGSGLPPAPGPLPGPADAAPAELPAPAPPGPTPAADQFVPASPADAAPAA